MRLNSRANRNSGVDKETAPQAPPNMCDHNLSGSAGRRALYKPSYLGEPIVVQSVVAGRKASIEALALSERL